MIEHHPIASLFAVILAFLLIPTVERWRKIHPAKPKAPDPASTADAKSLADAMAILRKASDQIYEERKQPAGFSPEFRFLEKAFRYLEMQREDHFRYTIGEREK